MKARQDRIDYPYPRRRVIRAVLKTLARWAFHAVARVEVRGLSNIPAEGPCILAGNHFHFADPAAMLWLPGRQVEFVGGFRFPNAPWAVKLFPGLWGYFPVHRGAYSRSSLDYAVATLAKNGIVGIFPEGGAWARVLRPARPGIGYIAAETGAPIVPVALSGFHGLFRQWRPTLQITVGEPILPDLHEAEAVHDYASRKAHYERIGERTMIAIAGLLPEGERGVFSGDPQARDEAAKHAAYPFDHKDMRGM